MSTGFDVNLMKRSRPNILARIRYTGRDKFRINQKGLCQLLQKEFNAGRVEILQVNRRMVAIRTDYLEPDEVITAVQMAASVPRQELELAR